MSGNERQGQSPSRHVYDVIVIGRQLSGIVCTALLAKRGLRVLHFGADSLVEPFRHGEYTFPCRPFFVPPLKAMPLFETLAQELGLTATLQEHLKPTPLQLIEESQRYELFHDEKHRGPELARARGASAEAFDEILRHAQAAPARSESFFRTHPDFPPQGWWARWQLKRELTSRDDITADTPVPPNELVQRLLPFVSHAEKPGPLSRARTLGFALAGPAVVAGGEDSFWNLVVARARELRADVVPSRSVERLSFEGDGIAVKPKGEDVTYHSKRVVCALDVDTLGKLLPATAQKKHTALTAQLTAHKALLCVHWVVPEKALPRGLATLALHHAPGLDEGATLIQVSESSSPDLRVLTVAAAAPLALASAGEAAVRAFVAQLTKQLDELMPFTRRQALCEVVPWIEAPARAHSTPLFRLPEDSWLQLTGHHPLTPWKHIVLANRHVFPGLGFEGELLAAQWAARELGLQLLRNSK